MKFGDKLIELRKNSGYSQEVLAEKLGVSRQSVSKWESNNTYPETDKIVQIANLFDCSMDDLINDKVTDIESFFRKNKNNINKVWNSFLNFLTNSVDMFSKMTFGQGLKCIMAIFLLCFILNIVGLIICGSAAGIIANIFSFFSDEIVLSIRIILKSIFHLIWFIIAAIIVIHTFKIRYLNGYEKEKEEKYQETVKALDDGKKVLSFKKDNEKPVEFLGTLAQIVIIFIKIMAFFILICMVGTTIGLVVASVLLLIHISVHILFLWITLLFIASAVVFIQVIILLISFIFNKKVHIKANLILFICSIVLIGVSIAMIAVTFSKIEYITDGSIFKPQTETIEIDYKDNLVLQSHGEGLSNTYQYIIDNSIEDNKIIASREVDKKYFKLNTFEIEMDKMPVLKINQSDNGNVKSFYDLFIKNLKKNKIYTFGEYGNDPLIIRANEITISKLLENQKKLYLVEEERIDNQIYIKVHDDKVYFKNGLRGEFNALDDTITYEVENYSCKKEIEATSYGEKIIYICNYFEEE